mgnify:CR=1 FL=1
MTVYAEDGGNHLLASDPKNVNQARGDLGPSQQIHNQNKVQHFNVGDDEKQDSKADASESASAAIKSKPFFFPTPNPKDNTKSFVHKNIKNTNLQGMVFARNSILPYHNIVLVLRQYRFIKKKLYV